ncbi:YdcF family protein [Stenoxybacter acetivorans]|uniref:YdcF family protein n=1 Tax=Stenoxybacter acetivorans TaxID=422441 RepID=UPI00055B0032|nr:YdcF family protein [Stenoxybacter acetivorans]
MLSPFPRFLHAVWLGLKISLLLIFTHLAVCAALVLYHSRPTPLQPADAAVVLGAAAWYKQPSPVFRERINHAILLHQNGVVKKLLFTGGTPKSGFLSEAVVGKNYALQHSVPEDNMVYESTSRDTYQNLLNAKEVAENNNIESIIIVSDPYHMARAAYIAKILELNAQLSPTTTSRYTTWQSKLKFLAEESYLLMISQWLEWIRLAEQFIRRNG